MANLARSAPSSGVIETCNADNNPYMVFDQRDDGFPAAPPDGSAAA
ncbi:MAG TPA: hypothetical protein VE645_04505 [Pseudonocardiaceae bacterium]|nr:hypothetical protein [Pseudonocardiaceae bacterium]